MKLPDKQIVLHIYNNRQNQPICHFNAWYSFEFSIKAARKLGPEFTVKKIERNIFLLIPKGLCIFPSSHNTSSLWSLQKLLFTPSVSEIRRFSPTVTTRQGNTVKPACCKTSVKKQWTGILWNYVLTFICSHPGQAMGLYVNKGTWKDMEPRRCVLTWVLNKWLPANKWGGFSPLCFHRNTGSMHRSSTIPEVTCSLYTQKTYLNRHMLNRIYNIKLLSYMWPTFAHIYCLWILNIT